MISIFRQMAAYNKRMNVCIYDACMHVSDADLGKNRGAYFGSILGTLNHILVGDLIWLRRFSTHSNDFVSLDCILKMEEPRVLDQLLHTQLVKLRQARTTVDSAIIEFTNELKSDHLQRALLYQNSKGTPCKKNFGSLVQHLFSHQIHHRGQVSTLLSQLDIDIGVTDLVADIPDEYKV